MISGKVSVEASIACTSLGIALSIGVIEQKVAQMSQEVAWPACSS